MDGADEARLAGPANSRALAAPQQARGDRFLRAEKCLLSPSLVSGVGHGASSVTSGAAGVAPLSDIAPDLQGRQLLSLLLLQGGKGRKIKPEDP